MLDEWQKNWAHVYLDKMYNLHSPPDSNRQCHCGGSEVPEYSGDDCLASERLCKSCILARHQTSPCHRIMHWDRYAWSRVNLESLGLVLRLAAHDGPCRSASVKSFILGDLTGFHKIKVPFQNVWAPHGRSLSS